MDLPTLDDILAARERLAGQLVLTPCERSETLSRITGADILLKKENKQFTASFKERGALNRLLTLGEAQRRDGVIAMSAGNHAQAVAYHAQRLGIRACIVMPKTTPNAKVEQTRVFGPEIILHGNQFDETMEFTRRLAEERGLVLVHPYDDPAVIAGQGTIGLELAEQVPDLETVVVPIGGGGLISGIALALSELRPEVEVIGVQTARYSAVHDAIRGRATARKRSGTVAEGIAVKSPGRLTLELIRRYVKDVLLVEETAIEDAVFQLLEIEKTVAEGAGAAGLAAVNSYPGRFAGKRTVIVLCGGNIDMMVLSAVLQRGMVRSNRLARLTVEISDTPGALAELTQVLGEMQSNILDITHQRAFQASSARATVVQVVLQLRGQEQEEELQAALKNLGFEAAFE